MANDPDLMYAKDFVVSARSHGPSVASVAAWTLTGAAYWAVRLVAFYPGVVVARACRSHADFSFSHT